MDRRFFVLSTSGEVGPFALDDLRQQLKEEKIQRTDQVRTAFGKQVGTVAEVTGTASGRLRSAVDVSGRHRTISDPRLSASSASCRRRRPGAGFPLWLPVLLVGLVFVVILMAWVGSARPASAAQPVPRESPTLLPQVRIQVVEGVATAARPGLIRITADPAPAANLVLRGIVTGMAPIELSVPAGASTRDIPITIPKQGELPYQVTIELKPGDGYVLGVSIHATVELQATREPGIAFDDFAEGDRGWAGPWSDTRPFAKSTDGGMRFTGGRIDRPLALPFSGGECWISLRFRLADTDRYDVYGGFSLFAGEVEGLFCGSHPDKPGMTLQDIRNQTFLLREPAYLPTVLRRAVLHLQDKEQRTRVSWWLDPVPGPAPPLMLGTMIVPQITFDRIAIVGNVLMDIGDLRLGRTWNEVVPLP